MWGAKFYNVMFDKDIFIPSPKTWIKYIYWVQAKDHQVTRPYARDDPYVQTIMLQ